MSGDALETHSAKGQLFVQVLQVDAEDLDTPACEHVEELRTTQACQLRRSGLRESSIGVPGGGHLFPHLFGERLRIAAQGGEYAIGEAELHGGHRLGIALAWHMLKIPRKGRMGKLGDTSWGSYHQRFRNFGPTCVEDSGIPCTIRDKAFRGALS